ncbi:MAG: hypothetical protein N4A36_04410 [Candidatus Gracilibacteria bacterium]|jgi:hypothetical protein|nr:hypothetical protein [Candidatus Gracilibacteria bacterium]
MEKQSLDSLERQRYGEVLDNLIAFFKTESFIFLKAIADMDSITEITLNKEDPQKTINQLQAPEIGVDSIISEVGNEFRNKVREIWNTKVGGLSIAGEDEISFVSNEAEDQLANGSETTCLLKYFCEIKNKIFNLKKAYLKQESFRGDLIAELENKTEDKNLQAKINKLVENNNKLKQRAEKLLDELEGILRDGIDEEALKNKQELNSVDISGAINQIRVLIARVHVMENQEPVTEGLSVDISQTRGAIYKKILSIVAAGLVVVAGVNIATVRVANVIAKSLFVREHILRKKIESNPRLFSDPELALEALLSRQVTAETFDSVAIELQKTHIHWSLDRTNSDYDEIIISTNRVSPDLFLMIEYSCMNEYGSMIRKKQRVFISDKKRIKIPKNRDALIVSKSFRFKVGDKEFFIDLRPMI